MFYLVYVIFTIASRQSYRSPDLIMASLAAFFSPTGITDTHMSTVRRMLAASPHRGRISTVLRCGHCVVGVSDHEGSSETSIEMDGAAIVAFSGILDNLHELGAALGIDRKTRTPARVVLAAYHKLGESFPGVLRGAFSSVVADGPRVFCFRDHIGLRSLFYRSDSTGLYVATEGKQVVTGAGLTPEPDPEILERIFFHAYEDSMPCALRGIHRIPKATVLSFDRSGVRAWRYWDPESLVETTQLPTEEIRSRFDELFAQAVSRMLTGQDVVSLSGGIDSPAVACYAARASRPQDSRPLAALSAVYPNFPSVDELGYIREVADHLHIELNTYEPEAEPLDRLTDWVRLCDGPVPTISLPHYEEHYRWAQALGYRTVLSGELAEFVFALDGFLVSHLVTHRRGRALLGQLRARRARGSSLQSLGRQVASSFAPSSVTAFRWRRRANGVPTWVDRRRANEPAVDSLVSPRKRWTSMQLSAFEGTAITMEAEELCQDVCRVRARMPWSDVDLWEFFLRLPAEVKFPDAQYKSLVRRLLRGVVPDLILDRRDKTVFDEAILGRADYSSLRKLVANSDYRMPGVDYELLRTRLKSERLTVQEFNWVKDLASIHAFVSMW